MTELGSGRVVPKDSNNDKVTNEWCARSQHGMYSRSATQARPPTITTGLLHVTLVPARHPGPCMPPWSAPATSQSHTPMRVRVRVRVIFSIMRDHGIKRSGNRTLVDGVLTSRGYSAQALKETNSFTWRRCGSKLIHKGVYATTDCVSGYML